MAEPTAMATHGQAADDRVIDPFPFADYPAPGAAIEVADGIFWVSTPVPFVGLKQVNLWLLRDGDGWTRSTAATASRG